jgi:hypothetical protein
VSYVLFQDTIDQVVSNTAAETTVLSTTIPANLLTGRALLIEQTGKYRVGNVGGRTYTIRLKLNGTQMFVAVPPSPGKITTLVGNSQRWAIQGSSSSQVNGVMMYSGGGPGSDTGNFAATSAPGGGGSNQLSVDLTADVVLTVTVQLSAAAATHEYTSMGIWGVLVEPPEGESAAAFPATIAAVAAVPTPTVVAEGSVTVSPSTIAAVASVPMPSVIANEGADATPSTIAAVAALPAPSTQAAATATPATVAAVAALPSTSVQADANATPATVAALAAVPTPAIDVGGGAATATPSTVAALAAVPTPSAQAQATPTPSTVAAVSSIPAVGILTTANAAPITVHAVAVVPMPTITGVEIGDPVEDPRAEFLETEGHARDITTEGMAVLT